MQTSARALRSLAVLSSSVPPAVPRRLPVPFAADQSSRRCLSTHAAVAHGATRGLSTPAAPPGGAAPPLPPPSPPLTSLPPISEPADQASPSADTASGPMLSADLTPARIVSELDRHIVGQGAAKRAMAIALRNRWRRLQLPPALRSEVLPKCCLLIGPTGVGKTEIARRLSKLVDAPFIKVEATKYTEVGFHGRDVEQIIRDLVDNAVLLARARQRRVISARLSRAVEDRILDELVRQSAAPAAAAAPARTRDQLRALLRQGALDGQLVDVDAPARRAPQGLVQVDVAPERMADVFSRIDKLFTVRQSGAGRRRVSVAEARAMLEDAEAERLLSDDAVAKEAVEAAESSGIVVIDEIDKIATPAAQRHGADASSEGVQRDLLPLVEGTVVNTKYGNVKTDHILFVAAGAFTQSKPADLMAELVGRLPIRVELKALTKGDLRQILTVPEHSLIRQQVELMATEGVTLRFTDAAIDEIADVTADINNTVENIGARRLHTVIERIMEDTSFNAPDLKGQTVTVDAVQVTGALGDLMVKSDLSRFIL